MILPKLGRFRCNYSSRQRLFPVTYRMTLSMVFDKFQIGLTFFVRHILAKFLLCLVYFLLSLNLAVAFSIVIFYEALFKPAYVMFGLAILAIYLFTNICFHYYKASTTSPGSPRKNNFPPNCYKCGGHKPRHTHHCSICDICVINMDHHCIWIGQCVGAKNHRYFFQFIMFTTIGTSLFVVAASNTFYYNFWNPNTNKGFCNSDLEYLPWFDYLCSYAPDNRTVGGLIFFTYAFCAIISSVVGLFTWFHFSLITAGETTLSMLAYPLKDWIRLMLWPFRHPDFKANWIRFLGIDSKRVSILNILFPSSHKTSYGEDFDDDGSQASNSLLAEVVVI